MSQDNPMRNAIAMYHAWVPHFWELLGPRVAEIGAIPVDQREEMSSKCVLHKQKKKKVFQIELEMQLIKILEVASAL